MSDETVSARGTEVSALAAIRALFPVDALHVVVLLCLLLSSPLAIERAGAGWWLPAGYFAVLWTILWLAWAEEARGGGRLVRRLHFSYPLVLVPAVFLSLYWIVPGVHPGGLDDSLLISWDHALFGFSPAAWFRSIESPVLTDVMHLFYVSYFFLPVLLVVHLLACGRREELSETIFVLCFAFYLCYAGYACLPAAGPRIAIYHSNQMHGFLVTQPIRDVINSLEPGKADAFPSAHAAVTLVVVALALRHARRLGYWLVPLAVCILASLGYTRYHYMVDVLAGVAFAIVAVVAGIPLHTVWERFRQSARNRWRGDASENS